MFSVTSEAAASVSFQSAQPKPARPDPSQLNDSFGAMVDSSLPADTGNDRAPGGAAATRIAAPHRRSRRQAPTIRRSRDTAADQAAQNASDDRNASAQQASDAKAAANADANAAPTTQRSKAKSAEFERRRGENERQAVLRQDRHNRQACLGAAGRSVRDDAEPGRGCDPGRHRIDGCSGRTAGNRQRHGTAGHRSGGHRGQYRAGQPPPPRRRAARRHRSRSMSIPPPHRTDRGSRYRERRRGGVGKDRSSSRGRRTRRHGCQTAGHADRGNGRRSDRGGRRDGAGSAESHAAQDARSRRRRRLRTIGLLGHPGSAKPDAAATDTPAPTLQANAAQATATAKPAAGDTGADARESRGRRQRCIGGGSRGRVTMRQQPPPRPPIRRPMRWMPGPR